MARKLSHFGEVYVHTCIANGKSYVGQTTQGVPERWRLHLRCARSSKTPAYNNLFSKAIRKYGSCAFEPQTLSTARDQSELDNLEKIWIILLQTKVPNGYNLTDGGNSGTVGHIKSAECRANLSIKEKQLWMNSEYRAAHLRKPIDFSPEVRAKMRESAKLRQMPKQSSETIAKRVAKLKGQKRTLEQRTRMSAAHMKVQYGS